MPAHLRLRLLTVATALVLLAACSGSTTISAASTDVDADGATVEDAASEPMDAEATAATEAGTPAGSAEAPGDPAETTEAAAGTTAATAATDVEATTTDAATTGSGTTDAGSSGDGLPDGWIEHDIEVLAVAVPRGWATMTTSAEVEPVIAAAEAEGAEYDRATIKQFESLLSTGEAIIAFGEGGDNVNAFRQFGRATALLEHELIVRELELELTSFAENVSFTSEPRRFNGMPGVLVRGTYEVDGQQVFMYQFSTHEGTHLYFVTLTLFTGDDPRLATDLFKNFSLG